MTAKAQSTAKVESLPEHWFLALVTVVSFGVINGVFWMLRLGFKVLIEVFATIGMLVMRPFMGKVEQRKPIEAKPRANARAKVEGDFKPTVFVDQPKFQTEDFKVADRIVSIRLSPPVAVLHLRVYYAEKLVRREMIVTEPRLRTLMQGRRFNFPDAKFEPKQGLTEIKEDTVQRAEKLINSLGKVDAKAATETPDWKRPSQEKQKAKATAAPAKETTKKAAPEATPQPKQERKPHVQAAAAAPAEQGAPDGRPLQLRKGVPIVGQLVYAQRRTFSPPGRKPYESFEARIELGNGVEVPLRGSELERELSSLQIKLGERVTITPNGKVPVDLPDGREGAKNVYCVARA